MWWSMFPLFVVPVLSVNKSYLQQTKADHCWTLVANADELLKTILIGICCCYNPAVPITTFSTCPGSTVNALLFWLSCNLCSAMLTMAFPQTSSSDQRLQHTTHHSSSVLQHSIHHQLTPTPMRTGLDCVIYCLTLPL